MISGKNTKASLMAQVIKQMGLSDGFVVLVQMCVMRVGLVPVSCWAVAALCSISCLFAPRSIKGPGRQNVDVKGGGILSLS